MAYTRPERAMSSNQAHPAHKPEESTGYTWMTAEVWHLQHVMLLIKSINKYKCHYLYRRGGDTNPRGNVGESFRVIHPRGSSPWEVLWTRYCLLVKFQSICNKETVTCLRSPQDIFQATMPNRLLDDLIRTMTTNFAQDSQPEFFLFYDSILRVFVRFPSPCQNVPLFNSSCR